MRCDYCNVLITLSDGGRLAPYGIPLYVCKHCYQILLQKGKKESE